MVSLSFRASSCIELALALALLASSSPAQGFRLSAPLVPGGDVVEFQVTPDGTRAVYRADQDLDGVVELYGVSTGGGTPVRLNGPLVLGGDVGGDALHSFRISPDGSRVVYWADERQNEVFELFSVPIDGSQPRVVLNGPLVAGGDFVRANRGLPFDVFAPLTPDGSRVLYVADQEQDEVFELFSVPIDGSAPPVKLNGPLPTGGDVLASSSLPNWPRVTPDGSFVLYMADQEADGLVGLFRAPVDGSGPVVKLDPLLTPPRSVSTASLLGVSPDGAWVLYAQQRHDHDGGELFHVPLGGWPARARRTDDRDRLSISLPRGTSAFLASITPDSERVAYLANPLRGEITELFGVPTDGSEPSTKLSLLGDGPVLASAISSDGERVVYLAGLFEAFDWELFSVPIDGSEERVRLRSMAELGYVGGFDVAPDASRVVFFPRTSPGEVELHSTRIDGSTSPVKLNPAGTACLASRFTPDGRHVVYVQTPLAGGANELFAVPIDGSRPAWRLNAPLVPGGHVEFNRALGRTFAATRGERVLYLADQAADDVTELFLTFLHRPIRPVR